MRIFMVMVVLFAIGMTSYAENKKSIKRKVAQALVLDKDILNSVVQNQNRLAKQILALAFASGFHYFCESTCPEKKGSVLVFFSKTKEEATEQFKSYCIEKYSSHFSAESPAEDYCIADKMSRD